jgi:peptide/nickel transport system substrate-binding protein
MDNFTLNFIQPKSECHDVTVTGQIYETLINLSNDTGSYEPGLAERWDIVDDTTFVFHLRKGVKFHDGTDFNAQAVKYSFDWYRSKECNPAFAANISAMESVEIIDDYTVRIKTSRVSANFLGSLCEHSGYIVSPSFLEKNKTNLNSVACGTGPFMVDSYIEGDSIKLKRNSNYYKNGGDGKPLPYLDGLEFRIIMDSTALTNNARSGDVDIVDYISITDVPIAESDSKLNVFKTGGAVVPYTLFMNTAKPPFDNLLVRQAVSYAINYKELCDTISGGYGWVSPFFITPGSKYYNDREIYSYDPAKARNLLAQAGYPDGFKSRMVCISRSPDNEIVQIVQGYLQAVGIAITIENMERTAFNALVAKSNKNTPACIMLAKATLPKYDIWNQLNTQFGRGEYNWAKYETKEILYFMDAMDTTIDQDARRKVVAEFEQKILEAAPAIFVFQQPMVSVVNKTIKGFYRDYTGRIMHTETWLDR